MAKNLLLSWMTDIEGSLVNLNQMECLFFKDVGEGHAERYFVYCKKGSAMYILKKSKTKSVAKSFMDKISEKLVGNVQA